MHENRYNNGGVTGRPETMFPSTNVLGPLVPKLIVPCDTMSLDWYIPVILHDTFRLVQSDRDVSMKGHYVTGTIHLGDQWSQNIRTGTHSFGTYRHPTLLISVVTDNKFWMSPLQLVQTTVENFLLPWQYPLAKPTYIGPVPQPCFPIGHSAVQ